MIALFFVFIVALSALNTDADDAQDKKDKELFTKVITAILKESRENPDIAWIYKERKQQYVPRCPKTADVLKKPKPLEENKELSSEFAKMKKTFDIKQN